MTKEQLAAKITGREYGEELFPEEEQAARAAGLVIVFGASDDLLEFRGAINDEMGAYEGTSAYIVNGALWSGPDCEDGPNGCKHAQEAAKRATESGKEIVAAWGDDDYSWIITAPSIPHVTFEVVEGDEKYCRGIVFELKDCK